MSLVIRTAILARITNLTGTDAQAAAERARTAKVAGHRIVAKAEVAAEQLTADQHDAHARRINGGCELGVGGWDWKEVVERSYSMKGWSRANGGGFIS